MKTSHYRRLIIVTIMVSLIMIFATPVSADGGDRVRHLSPDSYEGDETDWRDCGTFTVRAQWVDEWRITQFYAADGTLEKELVHETEDWTITNNETHESISGQYIRNWVFDYAELTWTVTGVQEMSIPNNLLFEAGIVKVDLETGVVFEGGPHPFFNDFTGSVCSLFSE